jgi:hypothetical protein
VLTPLHVLSAGDSGVPQAPSNLLPRYLEGAAEVAPAADSTPSGERGTFVLCVDDDETHMRVLHGILVSQEIR